MHKPFATGGDSTRYQNSPESIDYWLDQWLVSYRYLQSLLNLHPNLLPVCYEQMSSDPTFWKNLSARLDCEITAGDFTNKNRSPLSQSNEADPALLADCNDLYRQLQEQATTRL